jgi:hypothetical protein
MILAHGRIDPTSRRGTARDDNSPPLPLAAGRLERGGRRHPVGRKPDHTSCGRRQAAAAGRLARRQLRAGRLRNLRWRARARPTDRYLLMPAAPPTSVPPPRRAQLACGPALLFAVAVVVVVVVIVVVAAKLMP